MGNICDQALHSLFPKTTDLVEWTAQTPLLITRHWIRTSLPNTNKWIDHIDIISRIVQLSLKPTQFVITTQLFTSQKFVYKCFINPTDVTRPLIEYNSLLVHDSTVFKTRPNSSNQYLTQTTTNEWVLRQTSHSNTLSQFSFNKNTSDACFIDKDHVAFLFPNEIQIHSLKTSKNPDETVTFEAVENTKAMKRISDDCFVCLSVCNCNVTLAYPFGDVYVCKKPFGEFRKLNGIHVFLEDVFSWKEKLVACYDKYWGLIDVEKGIYTSRKLPLDERLDEYKLMVVFDELILIPRRKFGYKALEVNYVWDETELEWKRYEHNIVSKDIGIDWTSRL